MKTAVYTSLISGGVLCLLLMAIGLITCKDLLLLMKTQPEVLDDSIVYLEIYIWGLPFLFFYNIANGIFSALGDSKTPFIFLAISSLSNIAVDILFVVVFGMGVNGVAWATFICQGVSCVVSVVIVLKRLTAFSCGKTPLFSKTIFLKISKVAIPSIFQQSFVSIGNMMIQGCINGYGVSVAAGYSAAVKLNNLVITSLTTIGNGISNYTAQNLGAAKYDRIRDGFRAGLKLVWIICIPFFLVYCIFGKYLLLLFMDESSSVALGTGREFLCMISPFYVAVAAKLVADSVLRGLGNMVSFMIDTFTDLFLRVCLAFAFSSIIGKAFGIWLAWPVGWVLGMVLALIFYRHSLKKLNTASKFKNEA